MGDLHSTDHTSISFKEALNNVSEAVRARQKSAKKRSLLIVNEDFEPFFNNALTTQVIIQRFLSEQALQKTVKDNS